jgi:signal transduction histidine kinase/ActR/RegA family two-component response regulator
MMDILSQAHEKFGVLDQIPLGICVLQSDQVVLFWNAQLEEWTKIPRSEILGTPIHQRFPHFNQPQYIHRLSPIFEGGPPTIFSSQLHKFVIPAPLPQGKQRIQHTTVTAVPALEGKGFYALFSIEDVTDVSFRVQEYRKMRDQALIEAEERRRAQEIAEEANRIKDEFLAIVSHELRTPLNSILGWSQMLYSRKLNESMATRALETIQRNAKLQNQLIDDILDVSRIVQGKIQIALQPTHLIPVIEAAIEDIRYAAEVKQIQIDSIISPVVIQVLGDASRLQQIVGNLLSNAVKFTPKGGQVCIQLQQVDTVAEIIVSDTGQGISADFLPLVFDRFRQADGSPTRTQGGLGLGLAIVRSLVGMHKGTVQAASDGEGKGATFTVQLPIHTSQQPPPLNEPPTPEFPNLNGLRVLLVDDNADTRDLIAFILEQCQVKVMETASASECFAALPQFRPDLLISDISMPGEDGYSLIRRIRAMEAEQNAAPLNAIALTAFAREEDQQAAIEAGFQSYLSKPVNPFELMAVVTRLVNYTE